MLFSLYKMHIQGYNQYNCDNVNL